jgi:CBS domain-containing protein
MRLGRLVRAARLTSRRVARTGPSSGVDLHHRRLAANDPRPARLSACFDGPLRRDRRLSPPRRKEPAMCTVRDILHNKGALVYSISPAASVLEATQIMNRHKLGALVVMHEGELVGIFTERDVLTRIVADMRDPSAEVVGTHMATELVTGHPDMDVDEASQIMRDRRIRHLPILDDDGDLCGLVSIGDLNAAHVSECQSQIQYLSEYIYGRV